MSDEQHEVDSRVRSALWAAYGDAIGFVTERVDRDGLRRRIGQDEVSKPVTWQRRVGGRFGPSVRLPAGTYSDDTQLRLATARCIRGDGTFDVGTFAKVELPVFRSYALGAGRGTKLAAQHLTNGRVQWHSNFFSSSNMGYLQSGGNGAAMRIQPHVWTADDLADPSTYMPATMRNAVVSHGHPRGWGGALYYAALLAETLSAGAVPGPAAWRRIAKELPELVGVLRADSELSDLWMPTWEKRAGLTLEGALAQTAAELLQQIGALERATGSRFAEAVDAIGATAPETMGAGTVTTVAAVYLAWTARDESPAVGLARAANALGTDTDTIATMAGALLGVGSDNLPPSEVQDAAYIRGEAERLGIISRGGHASSFEHPSLEDWVPPKRLKEAAIRTRAGAVEVRGLGWARAQVDPRHPERAWVWVTTHFGQSLLIEAQQPSSDGVGPSPAPQCLPSAAPPKGSVDELTRQAIASGFDPRLIGTHILQLANHDHAIEVGCAYAAIILKAKLARDRRGW